MQVLYLGRIKIWSCGFFGRRKAREPKEKPSKQGKNLQQIQHTYGTRSESTPGHICGRWALTTALSLLPKYYNLSRKTVNTRENFWNVYCFATNQMRHETAKDNCQSAALIIHDLTWNNGLAFSSSRNLQFYHFRLWYPQRIDMNDIFYGKVMLNKEDRISWSDTATCRQRVWGWEKNEPITSNVPLL